MIELVLAPDQATRWLSIALGSVHVDSIYQESTIIVFYLFSEKKRWWLTCAMHIAKSRVPVFTLNPHIFVFLSLLLCRYRMTNMYLAPPTLSALLVFWRWLTRNPNALEEWNRRITASGPAWATEWVQSNLMRLFQDKHWKWLGLWLRGRLPEMLHAHQWQLSEVGCQRCYMSSNVNYPNLFFCCCDKHWPKAA